MFTKFKAFVRFLRNGPFYSFLAQQQMERRLNQILDEPGAQAYIQLPMDRHKE